MGSSALLDQRAGPALRDLQVPLVRQALPALLEARVLQEGSVSQARLDRLVQLDLRVTRVRWEDLVLRDFQDPLDQMDLRDLWVLLVVRVVLDKLDSLEDRVLKDLQALRAI